VGGGFLFSTQWGVKGRKDMRGEKFIQTPSGRFHAVFAGDGEPLILVHGYSVEVNSWRTWERNIDGLGENFRVYALDLLGYGESDKPEPRLDAQEEANALLQLLDAVKIDRADFIGLSWGGMIVQDIALDAPGRVDKLVLVDSAFDASEQGFAQLNKIARPTLIVWDEDDEVIPVRAAHRLAKAIPNSRLEILTKAQRDSDADPQNRHWTQMTHSFLFNDMVRDFLREYPDDDK
jgi:pimeloyl-ACP methyl ester carboxylesterase